MSQCHFFGYFPVFFIGAISSHFPGTTSSLPLFLFTGTSSQVLAFFFRVPLLYNPFFPAATFSLFLLFCDAISLLLHFLFPVQLLRFPCCFPILSLLFFPGAMSLHSSLSSRCHLFFYFFAFSFNSSCHFYASAHLYP